MKKIEAYGCDYCSMVSRRKGSVTRHEIHHCKKSPNRITCIKCINFSFEEGEDHGSMGQEPDSWYCLAKEVELEYRNFNGNIICSDFEHNPSTNGG